jgi:predicted RNA-binding protein with PUA-like domain
MRYWLMKSEPDVFSIRDLEQRQTSLWDGVRNYQARNFMMNDMAVGDLVLFYHSNAEPPGVAGIAKVVAAAAADPTQFDKKSEYYDPKASKEKPRWFGVTVGFVEVFSTLVSLHQLRETAGLEDMLVLKKGQRLSIQPVTAEEFALVRRLGGTRGQNASAGIGAGNRIATGNGNTKPGKNKRTQIDL